ncbi:FtsK/SpoIIIE domain-containing protein [Maridesulfovibrio sp.]|uniref:FtsK/SpoIIIE domain-containing protein n=1 Tax=Maridesulfovibrio sp. TaxID=2795000 RepID=UPI002AA8A063|nr:FtsK/SpoIIIE domain-containing protein [Maridesulfovibrio sp.]
MSTLSIQQILNSRFRTSRAADKETVRIMEHLGLSTKASVARLAISRSLSMGKLPEEKVDAKGLEVPATSLFSSEDVAIWVGLCVTHSIKFSAKPITNMDGFRESIRRHWHRGVGLLAEDWSASSEDYDRFLETLINRRAELPEFANSNENPSTKTAQESPKEPNDISTQLLAALADIAVKAEIKDVTHGPRVSRYKVYLPDINIIDKLRKGLERLSLVLNLQEGLPILSPGDESKTVYLDIPRPQASWESCSFDRLKDWSQNIDPSPDKLLVFPGVDVMGNPFTFDLSKAPHLLVGGATGQGKSVCLHALIASLVSQHTPDSLSLALIDPKQVEFSVYRNSKYLYNETVAVGIEEARDCIFNLVEEMDHRYQVFKELGVSNIEEARKKGISISYIAVFIEELADLVLQDREIEDQIVRLAQLARASGIHLVLATQRPDSKTFSGLIRSNIPARIALTVQKSSESKIILDEVGAEHLLGAGDMLVKTTGKQSTRVHGVYVSRKDIEKIIR